MAYDDYRLEQDELPDTPPRRRKRRWAKRAGWVLAILVVPIVAAMLFLSSPIGKRFVADQIADVAPASGLRFSVGRIEGDIYDRAVLHDVVLSDPKGPFLTIPLVELDWRPLQWLTSGLDIRKLAARRGTLMRMPELLPGDPDAPILPDFDIRIDTFEIENLTLAPGVAGDEARRVDLMAQADIRRGHVFLEAAGKFGAEDTLALLIDAEPDGDRFDLALDYRADADGAIASILGTDASYRARIAGDGSWADWLGHVFVQREGERFAAFRLTNKAGQYGLIGQLTAGEVFDGLVGDVLGAKTAISADGTIDDSTFAGTARILNSVIDAQGKGAVDLAGNAFDDFNLALILRDPTLFGEALRLENGRLDATLDGKFRALDIDHSLAIGALVAGDTRLLDLSQSGLVTFDGQQWTLPLDTQVKRIDTGSEWIDPRLVNGSLRGTLSYDGTTLRSDLLRLVFPGLEARLGLRGNVARGGYALVGPVSVDGIQLDNVGTASGTARISLKIAQGVGWDVTANVDGRLRDVSNSTIANLAGDPIAFKGVVGTGSSAPLAFRDLNVASQKLTMNLDGGVGEGVTTLAGSGRHADYGPFTVDAELAADGPRAQLVFASPLPAAGLRDVKLSIAPGEETLLIDAQGQSTLGPFEGALTLFTPADGPARIQIERARVWETDITGSLTLAEAGPSGTLALSGGGLDGTIALDPRGGAQMIGLDLAARNASFGGDTPIRLARADIDGEIRLAENDTRITGTMTGQGLSYGSIFIGRVAAKADVTNGSGNISAAFAGRRGSRFNIEVDANLAPQRIGLIARGDFAGREIAMPRRAVLVAENNDGWRLLPSQLDFGQGRVVASGRFGGAATALELKLARMPLSLADLAMDDLGLGGTISGIVDFRNAAGQAPTGSARVKLDQLTRSGLVLSSRPLDIALVANLSADRLVARAALSDEGDGVGKARALITGLPANGPLFERLQRGRLAGALQYDGQADALWRLAAIDEFDLTGPLAVRAQVSGTLAEPRVRGRLASDDLRVRSGLSGTDIQSVKASGSFAGSVLRITSFAGEARNGGTVSGSGSIDLANLSATRGPAIDLKVATDNAALLDAAGLTATVTGPLRIVSDGVGGTIAGRLRVNRASWKLGVAADDVRLPDIEVREVNTPPDIAAPRARGRPWRYLIDATAPSRIDVDGMGLDSEWRADILIRGTTDDPRIGGEARMVRGAYSFAGTRFEMTRGRIDFDENVPIDPRIDIEAETDQGGLAVTVNVTGNAQSPEVAFSSNPALPEEEILSRLLFGDSITSLSATDALQLGAALASLRGGGGMDPINELRSAIGLDRLRIVGADPALDRGTGVALGKNFGRRFYTEIITDGRGYSATEVEFRVTNWLSLLASISTIGRESVLVEVSRDY